jgi:type I restriction enzyme S subunit
MAVGKACITGLPVAINQDLKALFCSPKLLPIYLLWFLTWASKQLEVQATGATVKGIKIEALKTLKIPLPSLEEQRRIAAILDKADAVRRKRKEAIALTEELLRSAFLEMFGDPVTNPKGWDIVPIESVAASTKNALAIGPFGSSLKVDDYRKSGHPVVFVRDIRENRFDWISQVFVDDKKFQELQSHHVRPGDVVATKMGLPPCIAAVYPDSMPIGVVTADIIKMTLDGNKMTPIYAAAAINSDFCKRQVARFTEGITRPKVTLRDFRELQIPCPPLSYQKRWEALCHQHQKTATKLSTDFDALNDLFNSLLQRAFRGEL